MKKKRYPVKPSIAFLNYYAVKFSDFIYNNGV